MPSIAFDNIKIGGIACALPDNLFGSEHFLKYFDQKEIDQFVKTSGVESRCYKHKKQTASDLCYVAAKKLMEHKNYTGEDIDAIIFITQTPDYIIPSTAFVLQKRLGIKEDCIVYDINLGCSALTTGVSTISSMINSGLINRALLLIGDAYGTNEYADSDINHDRMLIGDGCSACIIEKIPDEEKNSGFSPIRTILKSDGNGFDAIITPGLTNSGRFPLKKTDWSPEKIQEYQKQFCTYMDGSDVFLFAITKVPKLFKEFYKVFECSADDFDYFIFHQANKMILEHLEKKLKLPKEKCHHSIQKYGNTDGASVLITIADLCEQENVPDKIKFITSAFGIGLSWGITSFEIDKKDVLPIIYTNDYYEEGFLPNLFSKNE